MAFSGYIVYNSTTQIIDSLQATQTEADTKANTSDSLTAHQGSVTIPTLTQPGFSYFNPSTSVIELDREPSPSELEQTRTLISGIHHTYFNEIYPRIERHSWAFPQYLRLDVEDALLGQVRAVYIRTMDSSLTLARRRDYASKALLGPTEVTGHGTDEGTRTLFNAIDNQNFDSLWNVRGRGTPLEFLVWNNSESEYQRRNLSSSVSSAVTNFPIATIPDWNSIDILSSSWINTIPDYSD